MIISHWKIGSCLSSFPDRQGRVDKTSTRSRPPLTCGLRLNVPQICQARNREIARQKLIDLILLACERPKPRIATRPSLGSKRRRLETKTQRGTVKSLRGKVTGEE
jgi:hypothetical protein